MQWNVNMIYDPLLYVQVNRAFSEATQRLIQILKLASYRLPPTDKIKIGKIVILVAQDDIFLRYQSTIWSIFSFVMFLRS